MNLPPPPSQGNTNDPIWRQWFNLLFSQTKLLSSLAKVRAYRTATFTFPASVITALPVDTVAYDAQKWVGTATGAVTPKQAGYYLVTVQLGIASTATGQFLTALLLKNGALDSIGGQCQTTAAGNFYVTGSFLTYCNGSTDYLQAGGYCVPSLATSTDIRTANYIELIGPFGT